jgi:hypothetical protein
MVRKPTEHQAGHNGHGKTEDDIACVVRLMRPIPVSGAELTRDSDADQDEGRQRDHHTAEDQQPAVVVHVRSIAGAAVRC